MTNDRDASPRDVVELRRVGTGTELWPAIEAAQFARILVHDAPRNDAERRMIGAFVDAFSRFIEAWERTPPENRGAFLRVLGDHAESLDRLGLFVHWGCIERRLAVPGSDDAPVPLAVVSIDRDPLATIAVTLPDELGVSVAGLEPDD